MRGGDWQRVTLDAASGFKPSEALGLEALLDVEPPVLAELEAEPGRVFSRDQLMNSIYVDGRIVSDRTVDSHVKNLRQKLHDASDADDLIRSIYGVGYKLE